MVKGKGRGGEGEGGKKKAHHQAQHVFLDIRFWTHQSSSTTPSLMTVRWSSPYVRMERLKTGKKREKGKEGGKGKKKKEVIYLLSETQNLYVSSSFYILSGSGLQSSLNLLALGQRKREEKGEKEGGEKTYQNHLFTCITFTLSLIRHGQFEHPAWSMKYSWGSWKGQGKKKKKKKGKKRGGGEEEGIETDILYP